MALMLVLTMTACKPEEEGGGTLVIYSPNTDALVDVAYTFVKNLEFQLKFKVWGQVNA